MWNIVIAVSYRDFMQNLHRKMHKNRPQLLEAGLIILHDNTRPQIGPIGLGGVASCSLQPGHESTRLRLIPKVETTYAWPSFSLFSAAVIRAIRQINKNDVLDGVVKLPTRWDSVTEYQGDYIERLQRDIKKINKLGHKQKLCALYLKWPSYNRRWTSSVTRCLVDLEVNYIPLLCVCVRLCACVFGWEHYFLSFLSELLSTPLNIIFRSMM
jgi:hypothetical protein